jgi:hypothetical protein
MRKYYCLIFVVIMKSNTVIYAQDWTTQDSLWLQRVLNGTEKIQLNQETLKAIESGTLIREPDVVIQPQINPSEMPIIKSFEGVTGLKNQVLSTEMTTSEYYLYGMDHIAALMGGNQILTPKKNISPFTDKTISELKWLDKLTPRKATVDDMTAVRSGSVGLSFEDILRTIFWPSHRAKIQNAKNANAWKTYNEYGNEKEKENE